MGEERPVCDSTEDAAAMFEASKRSASRKARRVEALAHAATFAPTGRADGWSGSVPVGMVASFEI